MAASSLKSSRRQSIRPGRGNVLCQLAVAYRVRHVIPTIRALGKFEAITAMYRPGSCPNPAQTTLGREIGLSDRQVRNHLATLIRLRLIDRWSYKPVREPDGTFTRATNRYRLCDLRSRPMLGKVCPLPRRNRRRPACASPPSSQPAAFPTGNQFPLMSTSSDKEPGGPVDEPPSGSSPHGASPAVLLADTEITAPPPWIAAGTSRAEWFATMREHRD